MKLFKKTPILLLFVMIFSCAENLDFNQIDDLTLNPVYETSLIYFTVEQTDFIENGVEITDVSDVTRFTAFESGGFRDNLEKTEVDFKINNKFNRAFQIVFAFLDENNNEVYVFNTLNITENQHDFTQTQSIIVDDNPLLKSSRRMKVSIHLLPSMNPIDPNIPMSLEFQTSAKFYLNF